MKKSKFVLNPEQRTHAGRFRIDQAVEFPLPDAAGRQKLIGLYSQGFRLSEDAREEIIQRTEHASAAFIKELMRRSVQYHLGRADCKELGMDDVRQALDERDRVCSPLSAGAFIARAAQRQKEPA